MWNALGLAQGGIQLSQVSVPTALNTGSNSGPSFCILFGTHVPFGDTQLASLYRNHGRYVSGVSNADAANVAAGYLLPGRRGGESAGGRALGRRQVEREGRGRPCRPLPTP